LLQAPTSTVQLEANALSIFNYVQRFISSNPRPRRTIPSSLLKLLDALQTL